MQTYILIATLLVASLSLFASIYLVGKVKWVIGITERHKRSADNQRRHLFRQLQILQALQSELGLPHQLPPTGGKAGSPDFLKAVADHVLEAKPGHVVECGSGLTTTVIARCLQLNGAGHVFAMEHLPKFAAVTRAELARQGLSDWATVLDAPLVPQDADGKEFHWYRTAGLPEAAIDLLIVDGPPARTGNSPRYPAGPRLFPRLAPRGAIFVDDAKRPEERAVIERWRKQFNQLEFEVDAEDFQKGICIAKPMLIGSVPDSH